MSDLGWNGSVQGIVLCRVDVVYKQERSVDSHIIMQPLHHWFRTMQRLTQRKRFQDSELSDLRGDGSGHFSANCRVVVAQNQYMWVSRCEQKSKVYLWTKRRLT